MTLEDRWLRKIDGLKVSPFLTITFILLFLIGLVVYLIPELQIGLPRWLRAILAAPLVLMWLAVTPFLLLRWIRALSWPFRKVTTHLRKPH